MVAVLPLLLAAVSMMPVSFPSKDAGVNLTGSFYSAGPGPLPALVVLHPCSGLDDATQSWGRWLAENGYDALAVDSLGPRHMTSLCGNAKQYRQSRVMDAYGALAYLRGRPDIDGAHVGVIGFSDGGAAVLFAENASTAAASGFANNGFAASIALYPGCGYHPTDALSDPLLLLVGASDDYTPAAECQQLLSAIDPSGAKSTLHLYPGVYHKFDDPSANRIAHVDGHAYTLRYDAAAAADAHQRVLAFLKQWL
jgi:dienelactone hydrolase